MSDKIVHPTANVTRSVRHEEVDRNWVVIDAADKTLGRLASQVAHIIRGKHKPYYTPHVDCGDYVVVINADKIQLRGKREGMKTYFHHTGYPGGGITRSFRDVLASDPEFIIRNAVKGMLPKTRLGREMINKLKVYAGADHPHQAQKPQAHNLSY